MSNLHTFTNKILFQELAKKRASVVLNSVQTIYMYLIVILIKCTVHMPRLHASVPWRANCMLTFWHRPSKESKSI